MSGRNMPAVGATPSFRPRHQRCQRRAAAPRRACSRICWWRNIVITCRSIARARSTPARGSNSTAPLYAIGSGRRPGCSPRSQRQSGATYLPPRKSMATTRQSRCCPLDSAEPRPDGSGFMCATTDCSVAQHLRPPPISTARTAAASIQPRIWPGSPACSRGRRL